MARKRLRPAMLRAALALLFALLVAGPAAAPAPMVKRLLLVGCFEPCAPGEMPVQFEYASVDPDPDVCGAWVLLQYAPSNLPGNYVPWTVQARGHDACITGGVYFLGATFRVTGPDLVLEGTRRSLQLRCTSVGAVDLAGGVGDRGVRLQGLAWSDALC